VGLLCKLSVLEATYGKNPHLQLAIYPVYTPLEKTSQATFFIPYT